MEINDRRNSLKVQFRFIPKEVLKGTFHRLRLLLRTVPIWIIAVTSNFTKRKKLEYFDTRFLLSSHSI